MWGVGGPGAAAASVSLSGARDCFLHLPPALASSLRLQQDQAVKAFWGNQPVFLGWTELRHYGQHAGNVEMNRQLAEKLGIKDGQQAPVSDFLYSALNQLPFPKIVLRSMT